MLAYFFLASFLILSDIFYKGVLRGFRFNTNDSSIWLIGLSLEKVYLWNSCIMRKTFHVLEGDYFLYTFMTLKLMLKDLSMFQRYGKTFISWSYDIKDYHEVVHHIFLLNCLECHSTILIWSPTPSPVPFNC